MNNINEYALAPMLRHYGSYVAGLVSAVAVPVGILETVLASPAMTLARRASLGGGRVTNDELEAVFSLIWRGIARADPTSGPI